MLLGALGTFGSCPCPPLPSPAWEGPAGHREVAGGTGSGPAAIRCLCPSFCPSSWRWAGRSSTVPSNTFGCPMAFLMAVAAHPSPGEQQNAAVSGLKDAVPSSPLLLLQPQGHPAPCTASPAFLQGRGSSCSKHSAGTGLHSFPLSLINHGALGCGCPSPGAAWHGSALLPATGRGHRLGTPITRQRWPSGTPGVVTASPTT